MNPLDGGIAAGRFKSMFRHEYPLTLGRDVAGVVEQVGEGVVSLAVGDRVLGEVSGFGGPIRNGAWAELVAVGEQFLAKLPEGVDIATAGAAPLVTLTALAVTDALELSAGESVVVVGATGGAGSVVVQLAKSAGAQVLATGRPEDEGFLRGLGVDHVLPRDGDLVAAVREAHPEGVDALVDIATAYQPTPYDGVLKDGGRVASATSAAGEGPGRTNVVHAPTREGLERVAGLLADGTVRIPIHDTVELHEAPEALGAFSARHVQGKLAVRVS